MNTFTIDNETNNIAFQTEAIEDTSLAPFATEREFVFLSEDWPTSRLIDIWNGLPSVLPVTRFKDRKTATSRIWKAIQMLAEPAVEETEATEAVVLAEEVDLTPSTEPEATNADEPGPALVEEVTVELASPEPEPNVDADAPNVATEAAESTKKATRTKKAQTGETKAPREGSKTEQVVAMLNREGGTTLEEIMTAMGWQKHTTRAMLSAGGSLTKKHGLVITSEKVGEERRYSIKP
jgi:hypothetical protein